MKIFNYLLIILSICLFSCDKENKKIHKFKTSIFTTENVTPIVNFSIDNDNVNMIIDTGSDISIIDKNYYEKNPNCFEIVDSLNLNINTINGEKKKNAYIVNGYINDSIPITLYVMDISNIIEDTFIKQQIKIDGIIGVDFLYKKQLILNFKNKTLNNM